MENTSTTLEPMLEFLARSLATMETTFNKLPGSAVIQRYVKSSHQNDPGRTLLELILIIFAIRTLLQSRTQADRGEKHFIRFTDKEIDELVDEWAPEPLAQPLSTRAEYELGAVPVVAGPNGHKPKLLNGKAVTNLSSLNFTGLAGNEAIKLRAVEILRKYGLGSCGPPGFYGTLDVHMELERDIADFLGTEASILYSQGFSTISSVIPAFCKRGDIIVADRGVNFAIQKGIQISRSTVRWYDHNDLKSLEEVLESVEKERKKRRQPLTRRFIITEGVFEKDGAMIDLPKLIELKYKHKYRLILDESYSFGTVGRTGRGLTELYNVPVRLGDVFIRVICLLEASLLGSHPCGGFCAGSEEVVNHQRINGLSFVFSAAMPALLSVSGSEAISLFRSTPSIFTQLQDNIRAARAILDRLDCITVPSHAASPIIHICIRQPYPSNPTSILPRDASRWEWDIEGEERLLQEIVEECLSQGVMITKAKRLRGQELVESRPSIRLAMTSALSKKETEKAVNVVKAALIKTLSRKK
ncbi:serine palmitoyltransferase [Amanita rubescens]|nr:serine palmitoyltransferase [Amanita rubescens]